MSSIALLQLCSSADWPTNRAAAARLLRQAADGGAHLAVLPENWAIMGFKDSDKLALAEPCGSGPIQAFLSQQARDLGLWIVGGTLPEQSPEAGRVYAACPVYNAHGEEVARYRKIHLFDVSLRAGAEVYRESATVAPGSELVVVDSPVGRLGLSVCYDVRFPELFRALSARGAEVLLVPAAFTVPTGQAHWEVLLRARAIENLCYVAAPGQVGTHDNGRQTWGHSLVVAPWGEKVAEQAEGEGVVFATLDLAELAARRASIPCLEHRRLG